MAEMKFDMSGGAAVHRGASARSPRLRLPVRLVGGRRRDREPARAAARSSPATSSRRANGKTIEVNNTDAEGRLVLADCLATRSRRAPSGSSTWRR